MLPRICHIMHRAQAQTGSGKSFSMFGAGDLVAGASRGLVPRAANAIFAGIRASDADEVTIKVVRHFCAVAAFLVDIGMHTVCE